MTVATSDRAAWFAGALATGRRAGPVEVRIRRLLAARHAMGADELGRVLDLDEGTVRARLDELLANGEVERLRPVAYGRDDQDFFRLLRAGERSARGQA